MKKIWTICLISALFVVLFSTTMTFAAVSSFDIKSWNADDMEIGETSGSDGLEFLQPKDASATKVMVKAKGRSNKVGSYTNAIITGGASSMLDEYVPKTRAIKFNVSQACDINIYAYGASSSGDVNMVISREGNIVKTFETQNSELGLYKAFLDSKGDYYIYSPDGSIGICEVKVGYVSGDMDCDFDLDWNDSRLFRKAVYESYRNEYMTNAKLDMDDDGIVTVSDLSKFEQIILGLSTTERDKAKFVDDICWKADDMSLGYLETYNGLEFVDKACDRANQSICTKEINKVYNGLNESNRVFERCISTDGESTEGKNEYPITKAVKFNLDSTSYVTVYMSTGSTNQVQHKAQIVNADGELIAETNLTNNIGKYTFELDGNESYFINSSTGTLRIYEIDVRSELNKSFSKTVSVTANTSYKFYLTADNGVLLDSGTVKLSYNSAAMTLETIGGSSVAVGKCADGTKITEVGQGYVTFIPYNWNDGESGILTNITFKAKSTGTTTITIG